MRLLDAFRAFDHDRYPTFFSFIKSSPLGVSRRRDGMLGCGEMWGGLEWLGMRLEPEDVYAVVRHVDRSHEVWQPGERKAHLLFVEGTSAVR